MSKLNKCQEKLLQQVKEFIMSKDDESKDEWYATERSFVKYPLQDFLSFIGIHVTIEELDPMSTDE